MSCLSAFQKNSKCGHYLLQRTLSWNDNLLNSRNLQAMWLCYSLNVRIDDIFSNIGIETFLGLATLCKIIPMNYPRIVLAIIYTAYIYGQVESDNVFNRL